MNRTETITPKELKKIMKVSIATKTELGFYVSWTDNYIDIDRYDNWNPENVITYYFSFDDLTPILKLVKAYCRLYGRKLSMC